MRQDFFEFTNLAKLWLAANHKPNVRGTDYAIWRRIRLVPFVVTVRPKERDPHLLEHLAEERDASSGGSPRGAWPGSARA